MTIDIPTRNKYLKCGQLYVRLEKTHDEDDDDDNKTTSSTSTTRDRASIADLTV